MIQEMEKVFFVYTHHLKRGEINTDRAARG